MKYVYYFAFISFVIVLGWVFRPVEHMSTGTSKHPIYGPSGMDGKTYPEVYGPDGIGRKASGPGGVSGNASGPGGVSGNVSGPGGVSGNVSGRGGIGSSIEDEDTGNEQRAAMYEDDGEFNSSTATRNAAYMNVFTFKPYAKTNFPVSGPPEPYLSDFANFHK
jgi:hypothetical protein